MLLRGSGEVSSIGCLGGTHVACGPDEKSPDALWSQEQSDSNTNLCVERDLAHSSFMGTN